MKIKELLFTERYRPSDISELILPDRIYKNFADGISTHLMLYGSAGTGKTSTAKAICKTFNYPYLYINASLDTGVDTVRNTITDFCSTRTLTHQDSDFKIVILDEVDGVSIQFFKALRSTMDEFKKNTRFITTCNYINKVPEPIQSRFELISFDYTKDEEDEMIKKYILRLHDICSKESLTIENAALYELIKRKFPDMRSMLNSIQGFKNQKIEKITVADVIKFNSIFKDVYELIFNNIDPVKNYQYLIGNYSTKVDDVLASLGNDFIEYIKDEKPNYIKYIPQIIITVCKYQAVQHNVIDPTISMLACIYELGNIIHNL